MAGQGDAAKLSAALGGGSRYLRMSVEGGEMPIQLDGRCWDVSPGRPSGEGRYSVCQRDYVSRQPLAQGGH